MLELARSCSGACRGLMMLRVNTWLYTLYQLLLF